MSEARGDHPRSRRERRLRDIAETGAMPLVPSDASEQYDAGETLDFEPEISTFNPDGSVRSRREIRALREKAIAEYQEQQLESTRAFSSENLGEVSTPAEAEALAQETAELEAVEIENVDSDEADPEVYNLEVERPTEVDLEDEASGTEVHFVSEPDESDEAPEIAGSGPFEAKPAARDSYSFPNIAPLDDSVSVFDTPDSPTALRAADAGEQSDFDDLISSAVAQEGSGSTTNTSALILPNMGHTGGLSGPLGETGELFVTGSFDLPKSLGETGGHARLLDSDGEDADEVSATAFGSSGDDGGMAPVSAARAVSARTTGALVSTPTTEKSRLPAVLIATGGGLIVVIAGLAVWAASTGFFS